MAEVAEVNESGDRNRCLSDNSDTDTQFTPIITLPEVQIPTHEENEEVILKLRAKLYRFDCSDDPSEWKERGTGELKLLRQNVNKTVRLVMRRDKTLKVCANHFIIPSMKLRPSVGISSHKSFIYTVFADFADGKISSQCFALRFASPEIATQFKTAFDDAREYVRTECKLYNNEETPTDSDTEENADHSVEATDSDNRKIRNEENGGKEIEENNQIDEITEKVRDLKVDTEAHGL